MVISLARKYRDVGVGVGYVGAFFFQQRHDFHCWGFAGVVDVLLVGQGHDQDAAALDGLAVVIQGIGYLLHHPVGHVVVDFACQLDKAGIDAIFPGLPGEVEGVDRDAVPAQSRAGGVGHEAEGLGGRSLDHFVDIDAHAVGYDLHFIDQADIHRPVNVFQQLAHLRYAGAADRDGGIDRPLVQGPPQFKAGGCHAANDLGNGGGGVVGVARIFPFKKVDQGAILSGNKATALQARGNDLVCGAGPGGAFQTHQLTFPEPRQDAFHRVDDKAQIRLVVLVQRGRDADDLCVQLGGSRKIRGGDKAGLLGLVDFGWGDAFDIAFAAVQQLDFAWVDIKTCNADAHFSKTQGQWQAHVTQAVDTDVWLALLEGFSKALKVGAGHDCDPCKCDALVVDHCKNAGSEQAP